MPSAMFYELDEADCIKSAGGGWDRFAAQNGAEDLTAKRVIGTSLWEHISDGDTKLTLQAAFKMVRAEGTPYQMWYRCDAPGRARLLMMEVTRSQAAGNAGLMVRHEERASVQNQLYCEDEDAAIDLDEAVRCSFCCRYQVGDAWVSLFGQRRLPKAKPQFTVCPDCTEANAVLQAARSASGVPVLACMDH